MLLRWSICHGRSLLTGVSAADGKSRYILCLDDDIVVHHTVSNPDDSIDEVLTPPWSCLQHSRGRGGGGWRVALHPVPGR